MKRKLLNAIVKKRVLKHCDPEKVLHSSLFAETYPEDQATCWLCWVRLTGEGLEGWKKEPYYSAYYKHTNECQVCGYNHWEGGAWFPFRYIKRYGKRLLRNPSFKREEDDLDLIIQDP